MMINSVISLMIAAGATTVVPAADSIAVNEFSYYGPMAIHTPLLIDSLDVNAKAYSAPSLLDASPASRGVPASMDVSDGLAPGSGTDAMHVLEFYVDNTSYATPTITVKGLTDFRVSIDGKDVTELSAPLKLTPATHKVSLRYLTSAGRTDSLAVTVAGLDASKGRVMAAGNRRFGMDEVLDGPAVAGASISPDGKMAIECRAETRPGGATEYEWLVRDIASGRVLRSSQTPLQWMPSGGCYWFTRKGAKGRRLVSIDPVSGTETILSENIPEGNFRITPDARALIYTIYNEGPKEDPGVYQVLEPDDRQAGWRNRAQIWRYDLASGLMQPLTHGHKRMGLYDISDDSRRLLIGVYESRLTQRPTTLTTILDLDLTTMQADTVVDKDGFVAGAIYAPDGKSVLISGSPEAFGRVGCTLADSIIPSMYDYQLYMRLENGEIVPLTRQFDPSVENMEWSRADGKVYFTASDADYVRLYRLDPDNGRITPVSQPEEVVNGFSLPDTGTDVLIWGQGVDHPVRLGVMDMRRGRYKVMDNPRGGILADVDLGVCSDWNFVNSRGDTIVGRYYLPPHFDPEAKYPVIVNYYGGCTPTSRNFATRYPHHAYAAQGYVVYVLQPSGAAGFGQEFASRHVNTAGQGVAEDIIEGTQRFCREHSFADSTRIGCIGASYGGFMTQYLQTVTPMFAAAISHAGISDHTSYWGEGYWGYSYSEVSMAGSYPWTRPDLYVDQSPLFRADRITTPLLFLHGDSDNNVPVGESIQMFTALKLLGRPTAFVAVAGQDHHILDYDKRRRWQDTIFAWFERYLKDDPTWWNALYPEKQL